MADTQARANDVTYTLDDVYFRFDVTTHILPMDDSFVRDGPLAAVRADAARRQLSMESVLHQRRTLKNRVSARKSAKRRGLRVALAEDALASTKQREAELLDQITSANAEICAARECIAHLQIEHEKQRAMLAQFTAWGTPAPPAPQDHYRPYAPGPYDPIHFLEAAHPSHSCRSATDPVLV
jgi:hypothetical protein